MQRLFFFVMAGLFFAMTAANVSAQELRFESLPQERRDRIIDVHGEIAKKAYPISAYVEDKKFDKMNEEIAAVLDLFEALPVEDRIFLLQSIAEILLAFPATSPENYERFIDLSPPDKTEGHDIEQGKAGFCIAHVRAILILQSDVDGAFGAIEKHFPQPFNKTDAAVRLWNEINNIAKYGNKKWLAAQLPETPDLKRIAESCRKKTLEYYDQAHKSTGRQKPSKEQLDTLFSHIFTTLDQDEQFEEALNFAEKHLSKDNVENLIAVAALYMEQGQFKQAEQLSKTILSLEPSPQERLFWNAHGIVLAGRYENNLEQWSAEIRGLLDEHLSKYVMSPGASVYGSTPLTPLLDALQNVVCPITYLRSLEDVLPVVQSLADTMQATPHEKGLLAVIVLLMQNTKKDVSIERIKALAETQRDFLEAIEPGQKMSIIQLMYLTHVPGDIIDRKIDAALAEYDSMQTPQITVIPHGSAEQLPFFGGRIGTVFQISELGRQEKIKNFVFALDDGKDDKWQLLPAVVLSHFHPREPVARFNGVQYCVPDEAVLKECILECMNLIGIIKERAKREQTIGYFCQTLFRIDEKLTRLVDEQRETLLKNTVMAHRIMLESLGEVEGWSPQEKSRTRIFLFEAEEYLNQL
jgi:hypothetical protein